MRGSTERVSIPAKQRIPRISARKAAEILKRCNELLADSKQVLADLPRVGFAQFLALLSEDILRLATQPDSWGERARARLMSDIVPALQSNIAERHAVNIEDIAYCANIVLPCFLLELGCRNGHIEIEFPPDPTDSSARFKISAGQPYPFHSITNQRLLRLVSKCGEELVGLCYFGDQESRMTIEAHLSLKIPPVA
jgi:hypothetical protein